MSSSSRMSAAQSVSFPAADSTRVRFRSLTSIFFTEIPVPSCRLNPSPSLASRSTTADPTFPNPKTPICTMFVPSVFYSLEWLHATRLPPTQSSTTDDSLCPSHQILTTSSLQVVNSNDSDPDPIADTLLRQRHQPPTRSTVNSYDSSWPQA